MAYKVLSLKWRPQSFQDVVGQDHITQTLINAFEQDRIAQGYIFTGPRGVGKTTTARILAMALNAEGGASSNFDPHSVISREIADGRSLDVLEIDGASNRGIEEIRNLREQIKFAPMKGAFRVIIIDEVHMLTTPAFNALLRTLEEPPPHGKFIFATTDIHKVPATIISRCQRFDFNRISLQIISERLEFILKEEGITFDPESINAIAKKADGSMRDGLSLLDQAISFCGKEINYDGVVKALGLIADELYFEFTRCIREKDATGTVNMLSSFSGFGIPAPEVMVGMAGHIRNILYAGVKDGESLLEMNTEHKQRYIQESESWDRRDLLRISQVLTDVAATIRRAQDPYLLLEMTVLKLLEMDRSIYIDQIISSSASSSKVRSKDPERSESVQPIKKPLNPIVKKKYIDPEKKLAAPAPVVQDPVVSIKNKNEKNEVKEQLENNFDKETVAIQIPPDLNIEGILERWPSIMEKIHLARPSIGAILEECKPDEFDGNKLIIKTSGGSDFSVKMVERGIPTIEKILADEMGSPIKVNFVNGGGDAQSKSKPNKKKSEIDPNDNKLFNKIVEVFDGEILR
jgi:DNA polymerase-3 subunit gamma/tau